MSQISEGTAIKRPTLHHVNLKTTRLQEMIDWYATAVGMSPTYQFPGVSVERRPGQVGARGHPS